MTVGAVGAAAAAAVVVVVVAGSPAIGTMSMPTINIGALFIGWEEWEGNNARGVATEDNDADAEAGEYAHDFLEVALSRLWEGLFGRRTTTAKTMNTSRDNKHEEDVVLWLMFEILCKKVGWEMRRSHCHSRQPPAATGR